MSKPKKFFKSLRFRIMVILVILGIVPSVIITQALIAGYREQGIAVRISTVRTQCSILCDQIIKENYLNDSSSEAVNSKLELLSNIYGGRILITDRDFRIVKDTYQVDEGKTLISSKAIRCFRDGEPTDYEKKGQMLEFAIPVKSADVPQTQGTILATISLREISATMGELEWMGIVILSIIVILSVFLAYILSAMLVKPLARVTKSIEDLTDGYQNEAISVPDYTETELITDAFNKMLTRMKVLDESRSEFVSNVSHELKTPMTTISGYVDGILDGTIPPERRDHYLHIVSDETKRLSRLVRSMLDISQLQKEQGIPEDKKVHFDLEECAGQVLITFEKKINDKHLNVDVNFPEHPVYTMANRDYITQVIYNLIDNAVKFCPEGGTLGLKIREGSDKAYVSVSNDGETIPPEELSLVFDRFHKLDKSRSQNRDGWGLGLYIVKTIVCSHGENISVTSKDGKTEFTFTMPLIT